MLAILGVAALTLARFQLAPDAQGQHRRKTRPTFGYIPIVANVIDTGNSSNPGGNKILWSFTLRTMLPTDSDTFLAVSMVDSSQIVPTEPVDLGTTQMSAVDALKKVLSPRYPRDKVSVSHTATSLDYTYSQLGLLPTGDFILVACTVDTPIAGPGMGHWFAWFYPVAKTLR